MIIIFNPSLFESKDEHAKRFAAKIIMEIFADKYLWDGSNLDELFLKEGEDFFENEFCKHHFSNYDINYIKEQIEVLFHESAYVTKEQNAYLQKITVGIEAGDVHPETAYNIIQMESRVILENGVNDIKFIKGIAQKFINHPTRKSVYGLIVKFLDRNYVVAENAGGKGQIRNRITDLISNRYKASFKFRLMTIFDSDRDNDTYIEDESAKIIKYLKSTGAIKITDDYNENTDLIVWHMLYKREMENYIPSNVLFNAQLITQNEHSSINQLSPQEQDFIRIENYVKSIKADEIKREFPNAFLTNAPLIEFETRCAHHLINIDLPNKTGADVTELEVILLKLARIL